MSELSEHEALAADLVELVRSVAAGFEAKLAIANATIAELRTKIDAIPSGKDGAPGKDGVRGEPGLAGRDGAPGKDGQSIEPEKVLEWVAARTVAAVAALPLARDGKDGRDGASVSLEAVQALVGAEVTRAVAALPAPVAGKDGRNGTDGVKGDSGAAGKDGINGKDGADAVIDVDQVVEALKRDADAVTMLRGERGERGAPGERGEVGTSGAHGANGRDGKDGTDGAPVTLEQLREAVEARFNGWALEFERLATDRQRSAIDAIPLPRDGRDGKDGKPGFGLEDFEFDAVLLDERTIEFTVKAGGRHVGSKIVLAIPIDRGPYPSGGGQFERGDGVTFGGQWYIAQTKTKAKPGESPDWRLAVRRGRDGKDAAE